MKNFEQLPETDNMEYGPATIIIKIPEKGIQWTADEAQAWARGVLAGGPPDKPVSIQNQNEINWADIKKHVGEQVRIVARPKGLILTLDDGSRKYIAGDATSSTKSQGSTLKSISTSAMQDKSKLEEKIRTFAKAEIQRYNKINCEKLREKKVSTTFEFWSSGKRIRLFLRENDDISLEKITQALEQWGRGNYGYGKRIFDYAAFFYDWKNELRPDNPIFTLSETRIMNIILATKDPVGRDHLVSACLDGPFKNFSDSHFKWVTGQSLGNFPEKDKRLFKQINSYGTKVMKGGTLSKEESNDLNIILNGLQKKNTNLMKE